MEITVNHQPQTIQQNCSLQNLLFEVFKLESKGIAVAINQNIIPKTAWASHLIKQNDQITIIKPTQGG
jgi:sulfur carrier protein